MAQAQVTAVETPTAETLELLRHPAGANCLPFVIDEIVRGRAQLWKCSDERDTLYVVTRLDHNPTEWVATWCAGTGVRKFGPMFIAVAKSKGWGFRIHVENLARARLFSRLGFQCNEYVLRV